MTEFLLALKGDTDTITQAWQSYTPGAVTSGSGSLTSASASGRVSQPLVTSNAGLGQSAGKLVSFSLVVTVTTNGTGATSIIVASALPVRPNVAAGGLAFSGVRTDNGKAIVAVAGGTNNQQLTITQYDGTYPAASGAVFVIQGTYEAF